MTEEQIRAYMALEGIDPHMEFCDRRLPFSIYFPVQYANEFNYAMRNADFAVYQSVGKKQRLSPSRHLGNDEAGKWRVIDPTTIPLDIVIHLIEQAKG